MAYAAVPPPFFGAGPVKRNDCPQGEISSDVLFDMRTSPATLLLG